MFYFQSLWACNLCRKKQELALKTGQWYNGARGQATLQRKGSLIRQTSFNSDTDMGGGRRSRDMMHTGAAKRSSSAHALTDTDRMDESGNHTRMNLRGRANGELLSGRPRLRGEMETTPFIIPSSKPALKRQNSDTTGKDYPTFRQQQQHQQQQPLVPNETSKPAHNANHDAITSKRDQSSATELHHEKTSPGLTAYHIHEQVGAKCVLVYVHVFWQADVGCNDSKLKLRLASVTNGGDSFIITQMFTQHVHLVCCYKMFSESS